jgi:F-type H+-transporting ATPase subunit b
VAQNSIQPTATTGQVPASEHGRGFPPFDSQTFASQLVWLAVTFVALYLLMSRVALPRIGSILDDRRRHIEDDLAQAQRFKGLSDDAIAAHEKALNDARARAQVLAGETRTNAMAAAEARRRELDAKLSGHISEAEKVIAGKRSAALANVAAIAGEAASAIVERLIGTKPPTHEVGEAVDAVLKS